MKGYETFPSTNRPAPSVPPHAHRWRAAGLDQRISNGPIWVIQSCECGAVRRTAVAE